MEETVWILKVMSNLKNAGTFSTSPQAFTKQESSILASVPPQILLCCLILIDDVCS